MLCVEQINKLIKDELKFNVKACNIKTDWLKDKQIIALNSDFQVFEIFPHGVNCLELIRRTKEINYLVIKHSTGMYLSDTREGHHLGTYRSRQSAIWDHFRDTNKLSEVWWDKHLKYLAKRGCRAKTHLPSAENYLVELNRWYEMGIGSNNFNIDVQDAFLTRIETVKSFISKLKEAVNENGCKVSESVDTLA